MKRGNFRYFRLDSRVNMYEYINSKLICRTEITSKVQDPWVCHCEPLWQELRTDSWPPSQAPSGGVLIEYQSRPKWPCPDFSAFVFSLLSS